MKYLVFILLLISGVGYGQTKYYIRADSTVLQKIGGSNELIIENGTKSVTGGVLTNIGNGRTSFVTPGSGMIYPGAGIPVSTGAAWSTSISNSSTVGHVLRVTGASTYAFGAIQAGDLPGVPINILAPATGTNNIDNGNFRQQWNWNTLDGIAHDIISTSTAVTNTSLLLNVNFSGANAGSSITTKGIEVSNTRSGTGSINIAGVFNANAGAANHALQLVDGTEGNGKVLTSDATGKASWQTPSGGGSVTNFGLDSTGENFYGTLYDSTTWNNTSSFTVNGATVAVTANKFEFSGGNNDFIESLDYNYYTDLSYFKIVAKVKSTATEQGFGVGTRSVVAVGGGSVANVVGRFNELNGFVYLFGGAGVSSTQLAVSATGLTFSTNDYIVLTLERTGNTFLVTAINQTTNSLPIYCFYTFNTTVNDPFLPNIGKFSVFSFGGAFTVDSLAITSQEIKNAMLMSVGDSKGVGYNANSFATTYIAQLGQRYKTTIISAGGNEQTADVILRIPEIVALTPKQIILQIGSNDVRAAVPLATITANYDTIYNRITRLSPTTKIFPLLPFYESGIDQTGLRDHIIATYPNNYIATYVQGQAAGALVSGVHPSQQYSNAIFYAIANSGKLVGGNNSYDYTKTILSFNNGGVIFPDSGRLNQNISQFNWDYVNNRLVVGAALTFAAGTITTGDKFSVVTDDETAPFSNITGTTKNVAFGTTSGKMGFFYSAGNGNFITSISPGVAWRDLHFISSTLQWHVPGSSTPAFYIGTAGNVGIRNGTTATAYIHTGAGTASASTAPLKFTTGTLNTTPEVGAKEYNNAHYETNSAVNRYASGGAIKDFIATVDNVGTGETDLFTYTTKASTLAADGEKLNFNIGGTFNDLTATAQLQFYFGGTSVGNTGALTVSATGGWSANIFVIRTSSTTVRTLVTVTTPGASTAVYTTQTDLTGLTLSGTNIIKITGTAAGASGGNGDISAKLGVITWFGAANN